VAKFVPSKTPKKFNAGHTPKPKAGGKKRKGAGGKKSNAWRSYVGGGGSSGFVPFTGQF
jgi:hypothetical protein